MGIDYQQSVNENFLLFVRSDGAGTHSLNTHTKKSGLYCSRIIIIMQTDRELAIK